MAPIPTWQYLLHEVEGPIARVTVNRPRYRNAQSRGVLEELDAAFSHES